MAVEEPIPGQRRRRLQRIGLVQLGQLSLLLGSIIALLMGLSVLAIVLQAQRDEARSADWMIAVSSADPDPALVQHILGQQRRNFTPRILIVGTTPQSLAELLNAAGIPRANLEVAAEAPLLRQLRDYVREEQPAPSVLIIARPEELVLTRKMSRDLELLAFASPPPEMSLQIGPTLSAAGAYWYYALVGEP